MLEIVQIMLSDHCVIKLKLNYITRTQSPLLPGYYKLSLKLFVGERKQTKLQTI